MRILGDDLQELPVGTRGENLPSRGAKPHAGLSAQSRGHRGKPCRRGGCAPVTSARWMRRATSISSIARRDMINRGGENIYPKRDRKWCSKGIRDIVAAAVVGVAGRSAGAKRSRRSSKPSEFGQLTDEAVKAFPGGQAGTLQDTGNRRIHGTAPQKSNRKKSSKRN